MGTAEYDMYRNLGWTAEETWQFMIGVAETNDGIEEDE